jgi:MFS family permease
MHPDRQISPTERRSFIAEMSPTERRTFIATFGGWALDAFDFMVFTFVITTLSALFHIDKGQAGMLATVTLLFSAVGGWLAGILADRVGRVRVLQGTILWSRCAPC